MNTAPSMTRDQNGASPESIGVTKAVAVNGAPRLILRAEGAAALALACAVYGTVGGSWGLFALLFLVPDLSMLGYLIGPRTGAVTYNLGHTYLIAGAVGALGWFLATPMLVQIALILAAHIGFDRLMGYGLKYASAFGDTHLSILRRGRAD